MAEAGIFLSPALTGSDLADEDFAAVRQLLLARRRFDIGMYKDNCIKRRIAKRMRLRGSSDMRTYLQLLNEEPAECNALIATLSIHVSHFFRNPSTFAYLEGNVLPDLLGRAQANGRSKVLCWSIGCAGGEEPYSLALLLDELDPQRRAVILASDLSPEILARAREGIYDEARLLEVPAALRARYFVREGERYCLQAAIRRRVHFEQRDVLAPQPYPAVDLILCRNVLIYFSRAEQEKILCRFAAALPADGVLVLGRAETLVGEARRWFRTEAAGERIYRREDLPVDLPCN